MAPPTAPSCTLQATLELSTVAAPSTATLHALATITGGPAPAETDRKPTHIAVALDKSGSMNGAKLESARETLRFCTKELKEKDTLSLITYDSSVETVLLHSRMDAAGKLAAERVLNKLRAGNTTNLSGGLLAGIEAIRSGPKAPVTSVLLLTDGHANVGVKGDALPPLLTSTLQQVPGTTVFCMGFGADHDASLLRELSDAGGGVYYFIKDVDEIPVAFGDALGGLTSVVGQNLVLTIESLSPSVRIAEVLTKRKTTTSPDGSTWTVQLGDMYSEEDRGVPVRLEVAPSAAPAAAASAVRFTLSFADAINGRLSEAHAEAALERPAEAPAVPTPRNAAVVAHVNRVVAATALDQAKKLSSANDLKGAKRVVDAAAARVAAARAHVDEDDDAVEMCDHLMADLLECGEGLSNHERFRSAGMMSALSSKSQQHWVQRSNACAGLSFGNVYRKKSKMTKIARLTAAVRKGASSKSSAKPPPAPKPAPKMKKRGSSLRNLLGL